MSAATVVQIADRDPLQRLSALVGHLERIARALGADQILTGRLAILEDRVARLADEVQDRMPWVIVRQDWRDRQRNAWGRTRAWTRAPRASGTVATGTG